MYNNREILNIVVHADGRIRAMQNGVEQLGITSIVFSACLNEPDTLKYECHVTSSERSE